MSKLSVLGGSKAITGRLLMSSVSALYANAPRVAVENPHEPCTPNGQHECSASRITTHKSSNPSISASGIRKRTHLWLKELPPLMPPRMSTLEWPHSNHFVNIRKGPRTRCVTEPRYLPVVGKGVAKQPRTGAASGPVWQRRWRSSGAPTDGLPCDESVQVAASFVFPTGKVPIPGPSSQNQRRGHVVTASIRGSRASQASRYRKYRFAHMPHAMTRRKATQTPWGC